MTIEFITTRELSGKVSKAKGRVRIVKLREQLEALVDYKCPKCGFGEKRHEVWREPFVTGSGVNKKINVLCAKCGHKMTILKMKKEMAKEKKKKSEKQTS